MSDSICPNRFPLRVVPATLAYNLKEKNTRISMIVYSKHEVNSEFLVFSFFIPKFLRIESLYKKNQFQLKIEMVTISI